MRRSRGHGKNKKNDAISWFKASARNHVRRLYELVECLESHGVTVRRVLTDRPGYVVYEDPYQVAAVPFRETRTR
jgi:hypothetical protein